MSTPIRNLLVSFTALLVAALFAPLPVAADDTAQATTESRLRDALRTYMQQLQDAEGQIATLQATQAQSDKDATDLKAKIDALNSQVDALTKQSADDKTASDKAISDLKSQNADQVTQMGKLNDALAAWEKDDKQYLELAKEKEAARAQLAVQVILQQRVIDDRERKNLELYSLGNEILTRYEKFGLGDALGAKEPFTGLSRVKLQEDVQDYKDKIADQRTTPGEIPPMPPASATPTKTGTAPASSTPATKQATRVSQGAPVTSTQ